MSKSKNVGIFVFGVVFAPLGVLLHECGHYVVARSLGLSAFFHSADITLPAQPELTTRSAMLVGAGGPLVDVLFAVGGFFWLRHLRNGRQQQEATRVDWLATFFALEAARWLRCLTGTPANPQPGDEARLSQFLGLPGWLLPFLLLLGALALLVLTIRLHPCGARLYPFSAAIFGLCLGAFLWVKVVGPHILL